MSDLSPNTIGGRVRTLREEIGMSLGELETLSGVSKSYIWNLENKEQHQRPSGETLYALAKALGTTMSDLLGRQLLSAEATQIEPSLQAYADEAGLSDGDVRMLASIKFRGGSPQTSERWAFIYNAIKASKQFD
ncbi:MAG: transcriptional regulator, family [Acidimicrobiales bacterium]|nr:transcriptional regulator, family [Acidimicrobiales bacterium]